MEQVEIHGCRIGARGTVRGGWALWMVAALLVTLTWISVAGRGGGDDRATGPTHLPVKRIDLNTAAPAELQLLPGVGPKLAEAIIASRRTDGLFAKVDDLRRVQGIGQQLPERWREYVTFQSD